MAGRLIDADALYTLFVKMKSFGELTAKKAIRCVEEAPTVDAIPVEWIKQFIKKENIDIIHKVGIVHMVEQWKLHPIDFEISSEDAIPVKWLKENYQINGVYGTESYFRKAHVVVEDILKNWELEKEKRKAE